MYLTYKRKDGVVESCIYRENYDNTIDVATGGDFRKGYITFTKEEFERLFMSDAIEILKHKPKKQKKVEKIKMKNYLLNVTFYAGSDDKEDTDRGLYILSVNKNIEEEEMENIFESVNELLNIFDDDLEEGEERGFPISYDDGINIDTLMHGIEIYTNGTIKKARKNIKADNCFTIEQWQ